MHLSCLAFIGLLGPLVAAHPGSHLFERAACNVDNCRRAVRSASSQGLADCSSFQRITVNGCGGSTIYSTTFRPYTVTEYSSTTTLPYYSTGPGGPQKRTAAAADLIKRQVSSCRSSTVSPTYINPAYTSACTVSSKYASACSCEGVTRSTITTNTVNTTYTVTYDSATTTRLNTVQTLQPGTPSFQIVLPGGRKLGYGPDNSFVPVASDSGSARIFAINGQGRLTIYQSAKGAPPDLGIRSYSGTGRDQVFGLREYPAPEPGVRFTCTLTNPSQGSGNLVCSDGGSLKYPVLCNDVLYYSTTRDQAGCAAVDLYAVQHNI